MILKMKIWPFTSPNCVSPMDLYDINEPSHDSSESTFPVLDSPHRWIKVWEPSFNYEISLILAIISFNEPRSYREASVESLWQHVMAKKLQDLENTHIWEKCKNPLFDYEIFIIFVLYSLYMSIVLTTRLQLTHFSSKLWRKSCRLTIEI